MNKNHVLIGLTALLIMGFFAYKSKSPIQDVKDKVGDAVHDTGQAIERAGSKIKEAAH